MTDYMPMPVRYLVLLAIQAMPMLTLKGLSEFFKADPAELEKEIRYLQSEDLITDTDDCIIIRRAGIRILKQYQEADTIPTVTAYILKTLIRAFDAENERDSYKTDFHMNHKQALQAKTALNMIKTYIQRAEILEQDNDDE